ncbi:MAG: hypothetical protein II295_06220 [Akkermansia sp.]|nr:hypothetical protein [Akkermansia sp.]
MAHQARNYDKAITVGHSRLTPNKDFAHFIVPRTDNGEELVKQNFFGEKYKMITCYLGDTLPRDIDFKKSQDSLQNQTQKIQQHLCTYC